MKNQINNVLSPQISDVDFVQNWMISKTNLNSGACNSKGDTPWAKN